MSTPSVRVAAVAPPAPVEDEPIYHNPDGQRPRLSFPARNLPHIIMAILRQFKEDLQCAATDGEGPIWPGGLPWADVKKMLSKEARVNFEGMPESEARDKCRQLLQEIADKEWRSITSHDLRKIVLLRADKARYCDIDFLQHLFACTMPEVAISYQWAAMVGQVHNGLLKQFDSTMEVLVWLDIFFNPQGASLETGDVLKITEKVYLAADLHVLIVHEGAEMHQVLQRAWIMLEIAVRAASDKSMVILVDLSGQTKDYFSNAMMITDGGRTRPKKQDFFSELTAYLESDVQIIQDEITERFHSPQLEGTGLKPKDMFNGTITDFVYFAGGLMQVREAVREGRHDVVTAVGWELAQALEDRGKFQDSLEVWEAVLSSKIEVFGHDHMDVAATMNNLGNVYDSLGEYEKALEYYEKDLEITIKLVGHDHVDVAMSLMNLGNVYQELGEYEKALEYHEKSLGIKIKVLNGQDHIEVAESRFNIGVVYWKEEKWDKVVECFEEAYRIRSKVFGHEHPNVTDTLEWLNKAKSNLMQK